MYKRILVVLVVSVILLMMAGCNKNVSPDANESVNSTDNIAETIEETIEETLPGVVSVEDVIDDPRGAAEAQDEMHKDPESTEAPAEPGKDTEKVPASATEPDETTEPTQSETTPTQPAEEEQKSPDNSGLTDYERYNTMSGEEQMAFIESFGSIEAFVEWYNAAKAEYEAANPDIEIGDGIIDAGDLVG